MIKMKRYNDFKTDKTKEVLTDSDIKKIEWTKYKIIVPTVEDKLELMNAFKHFHDNMYDSDIITANQLAHEYCDGDTNNIIVDKNLYDTIN